jgi:hypothetical protein
MSGQTVSGNYIFRDNSSNFSVSYCDFSKSLTDPAMQNRIGKVVVMDKPPTPDVVLFHAERTTPDFGGSYMNTNGLIRFDSVPINHGDGMSNNGRFTAPISGDYMFVLSGTTNDRNLELSFSHRKQGGDTSTYIMKDSDSDRYTRILTKTFVLHLDVGDVVHTEIVNGGTYGLKVSEKYPFTFSGYRFPT